MSACRPDEFVVEVGQMVLRSFAPALMFLLDAATSPGLLVRPRHGRLEFGGEYAEGGQTLLHPTRGRTMTAGDHLRGCVAIAHNELVDHVGERDLVVLDHVDASRLPRATVGAVDLRPPRSSAPKRPR
jgi:hypothetical protein